MAILSESDGTKRKLSGLLAALVTVLLTVPGLAWLVPYVQWAAGGVGALGLVHASLSGTVLKSGLKLPTFTSILAILTTIASTLPQLAPYALTLQVITGLLGMKAAKKKTNAQ